MWTHTYTHTTDADPARLWELLADVDGWLAWNDGIEQIALDGPLAVGSTFRMIPPGEDPMTSTIVALDPPRMLTDLTEVDGLAIRVEHRLQPAEGGRMTISYAVTVSGDVPDQVAEEIGSGVSADFPDVMRSFADHAGRP